MNLVLFYIFGGVAIGSALAMVLARNPIYSAVFLIVTLIAVAGEFLLLSAPMLAAFQVLIYAGAIMVLYLFVLMLLNLGARPDWKWWKSWRTYVAFGLVGVLAVVMLASVGSEAPVAQVGYVGQDVKAVARLLFSDPMMLFIMQALAVLLLIAVIAAVYLARHFTPEEAAELEASQVDDFGPAGRIAPSEQNAEETGDDRATAAEKSA